MNFQRNYFQIQDDHFARLFWALCKLYFIKSINEYETFWTIKAFRLFIKRLCSSLLEEN